MPLWNVRQLKRTLSLSFTPKCLQITQHLESCRKSCGKLQLQLSAACGSPSQCLGVCVCVCVAIIIFKSFPEYSCNSAATSIAIAAGQVAACPIAIASCCLLGKPQIKQRNPGGACNQWRRKKVKKIPHIYTERKNGIQASSETRRATCNMPPTAMFWLQRAAARRGRSAARQINARCMQTSCKRATASDRARDRESKSESERASTHVSARAFICRFRFRLSSSATSSGAVAVVLAHFCCCCCGQFQCSHCALISRRCCCCCCWRCK